MPREFNSDEQQPARPASSSQGQQVRGLKRAARRFHQRLAAKKPRTTFDLADVPNNLTDDWHIGYSRLDHLSPMATAVMDGLKKKGADIKWLCQSICGSAVAEGSQYFGTRWLSTVGSEKTFHRRLASSLPRTEMIKLPV